MQANLSVPNADGGILTGGDDGPVQRPPYSPVNPPLDARNHEKRLLRLFIHNHTLQNPRCWGGIVREEYEFEGWGLSQLFGWRTWEFLGGIGKGSLRVNSHLFNTWIGARN